MQTHLNNHKVRPPNLMKIGSKLLRSSLIILTKNQIKVNCPACNSKKFTKLIRKFSFNFVCCKKCNTVFINPRPNTRSLEVFYSSSKYIKFWNEIFQKTEAIRKEKIFKPRIKLVADILTRNNVKCNKLVEVGSGFGWFCELAKKQKLAKKILAIEPSPYFARKCKKIQGIEVIESTIEQYVKKNNDKLEADVIVNFELISHLFDPRSFIKSCYDGLKKDGMFICSTPNYHGLDIQVLKERSDYISPIFLNYFNPGSITHLLHSIGFRKIEVITPGLMDVHIVLNKVKSGELKNDHFFNMILHHANEDFIDEFQKLIQKYKMSSHMVISALK